MASAGCDAATGTCRYQLSPEAAVCDLDDDRCTQDTCHGGICVAGSDTCECSLERTCIQPRNLCLGAAVCRDGTCASTPVDCTTEDTECIRHYCNPSNGLCDSTAVNEGGPCTDGRACSGPGTCSNGACITEPRQCPAKPCQLAVCEEPSGCRYEPADLPCDDGNKCNGPDHCNAGECTATGPAVSCDDGNHCTTDLCAPATAVCTHDFVAMCCGNTVLESGEQCDATGLPGSGCDDCQFDTVSLDFQGAVPSFAWSAGAMRGAVAWEIVDYDDGRGVALRPLSALGEFASPVPIPAGTVKGRSMSPVLAALPDGFVLGALTSLAPEFWLLDALAQPKIRAAVRNPWDGGTPAGKLVLASSPLRTIAAWVVKDQALGPRLLYADLAVGNGQLLVSSSSVLASWDKNTTVIPGDACAQDDGVLVTFAVLADTGHESVVTHKVAFFQAGAAVPKIFDLTSLEWDIVFPAVCATGSDGRVMVVYPKVDKSSGGSLVIESVFIDTDQVPGLPQTVYSSSVSDVDVVFPFISDVDSNPDGGFSYLCPVFSGGMDSPESIKPLILNISAEGVVQGRPIAVEGPTSRYVLGLAVGNVAGLALSVFWVENSDMGNQDLKGRVAGRLYPLTGGGSVK